MESASGFNDDFYGRAVLVTGATSGIGRAVAIAFARAGAHVLVAGRDETRGRDTCADVNAAGGRATLLLAELRDGRAVTDLAARALDAAGGRIDVLVNNAGAGGFIASADVTAEEFDSVVGLNVRAPFFLTAAIAPIMAKTGGGAVVNLSAASASMGVPGLSLFGGAKAALEAMTRSWATEFGPAGVRVNAISVGAIETPINLHLREMIATMMAGVPARRMGSVDEVATIVLFLASSASSYINGALIPADGGLLIS